MQMKFHKVWYFIRVYTVIKVKKRTGGGGESFFGCGSRWHQRPSLVFVHYLQNQWMDFEQTCIDTGTLLGEGEELIRFW